MKRPLAVGTASVLLMSAAAHAADSTSPRQKFSLDPDWKFIKQDVTDAKNPAFDDSKWTTVSCPHTFNDVDTFDDLSPGGHIGELTQWAGRTWYRKHFTPDASWADKKVFVEFEGVRQVSEIYINGHLLGIEKNGFVPFGFDLTPFLNFGKENILSVMADNTFPTHGKDWNKEKVDTTYLGWNDPHWHPAHGGIYRNVYLHVTDKVHVTLPLFDNLGTVGTYAYAETVTNNSANIGMEVEVQNETAASAPVEAISEVTDQTGKVVLTLADNGTINAGEKHNFIAHATLNNPELWSPDHPYVYTVVTTIKSNGNVVDVYRTPLGARNATWSATTGLTLNGEPTKLHGFGQKPTDEWAGLGAAQPNWLHDYTLTLMKHAASNFVRWGHAAAGPSLIEFDDRNGIITYQPGVDGEKDTIGESWDVRAAAFRDVVIYFRNNPSILIWEVGNQKITENHIKQLTGYSHLYDPHGGRVVTERRASLINAKYLDIITSTEGGTTTEAPKEGNPGYDPNSKAKSVKVTGMPTVEGEYDREECPRRIWDDKTPRTTWGSDAPPIFGNPEAKAAKSTYILTGEQFAVNMASDKNWGQFLKPDTCGGAKWIFSDTTSGGRDPAEVARASGQVDGVRLPKPAFYALRVMYNEKPDVYIVGHWNYPAGTTKTVYVIGNGDSAELKLNGKSLGKITTPTDHWVFPFKDITFTPGTLEAISCKNGHDVAHYSLKTAGEPKSVKLTPITGPGGLRADGSDVLLIDAEVVDADGNRCPTFNGRIDFSATGPAIWRGGYNSGKNNSINNTFLDIEAGINRVSIRSTLTPGIIHVEARIANLDPASIDIDSKPINITNGMTTDLPRMQ
ncbi:MAG TPA: DUF4982 domain-containing protein [Phycisphaerae bacterium]|nr:DUF4982 domain-containing protein [Phycisphaerae bacterium]